jgi:hypothetical protein
VTTTSEPHMSSRKTQHSLHFFAREPDGSVRLRIRFDGEDASLIEEAAGEVPLIEYVRDAVNEKAREDVLEARRRRPPVAPPE